MRRRLELNFNLARPTLGVDDGQVLRGPAICYRHRYCIHDVTEGDE